MKKIFKIGFSAIFSFGLAMMSGCGLLFDPGSSTSGISTVEGFKICYNDNNYQLDNTYELYSKHILQNLVSVFAVPSSLEYATAIADKPLVADPSNYDRIRVQESTLQEVVYTSWQWTFATTLANCEVVEDYSAVVSSYESPTRQEAYFAEFVNVYYMALEVVAMQISAGITPQVYTISVNSATAQTKVYANPEKTILVDQNFVQNAKTQFGEKAQYVGFTQENVQTFKNYLLTNVVGSDIVVSDYGKVQTINGQKTYAELLDQILALPAPTLKNFLNPFPAATAIDIVGTTYYPDSSSADILRNIPAYEYQSVTIMPNTKTDILYMLICFEAQNDLTIDVGAYYYNAQTQTEKPLFSGQAQIVNGQNQNQCLFMVALSECTKLDEFSANFMEKNTPTLITNQNEMSKYFAYNNGAVLDKTNVASSFLTVTFHAQGAENGYCPFKWAFSSMLIGG